MSAITRGRDRAFWVHSAPDDDDSPTPTLPTLDEYLALAKTACPGTCCRPFWRVHRAALDELTMAYATRDEPIPYVPDDETVDRAVALLVAGKPTWCQDCQDEIRSALGAMDGLAEACQRIAGNTGRLAPAEAIEKGKHSKIAEAPSPSPAFDMVDLIERWPAEWTPQLAAHIRLPEGQSMWAGYSTLLGHFAALMGAPFAKPFGNAALALRRRAELAAGVDMLVHHLPAPCNTCQRKALERRDGSDVIECRYCHHTLAMADYQQYAVAYQVSLGTGESA